MIYIPVDRTPNTYFPCLNNRELTTLCNIVKPENVEERNRLDSHHRFQLFRRALYSDILKLSTMDMVPARQLFAAISVSDDNLSKKIAIADYNTNKKQWTKYITDSDNIDNLYAVARPVPVKIEHIKAKSNKLIDKIICFLSNIKISIINFFNTAKFKLWQYRKGKVQFIDFETALKTEQSLGNPLGNIPNERHYLLQQHNENFNFSPLLTDASETSLNAPSARPMTTAQRGRTGLGQQSHRSTLPSIPEERTVNFSTRLRDGLDNVTKATGQKLKTAWNNFTSTSSQESTTTEEEPDIESAMHLVSPVEKTTPQQSKLQSAINAVANRLGIFSTASKKPSDKTLEIQTEILSDSKPIKSTERTSSLNERLTTLWNNLASTFSQESTTTKEESDIESAMHLVSPVTPQQSKIEDPMDPVDEMFSTASEKTFDKIRERQTEIPSDPKPAKSTAHIPTAREGAKNFQRKNRRTSSKVQKQPQGWIEWGGQKMYNVYKKWSPW